MKDFNTTGAIILNSKAEVLLQKKDSGYLWAPNKWGFFGGAVEEDENPSDSIKREIKEELGMKLDDFSFFKKYPIYDKSIDGKERNGNLYIFTVKFNNSLETLKLKEGGGFAFFTQDEIPKLPMINSCKKPLLEYYKISKK